MGCAATETLTRAAVLATLLLVGITARAEPEPAPESEPAPEPAPEPEPELSEPNPLSLGPAGNSTMAAVVVRERRGAPFDPDSELRLTGRQLRELGITDLAEALDLLPGVVVRGGGRGGLQADIRGAKKDSVMVLIDGVQIQEPFFGNFDLSSIPTTDVAEIRISQAPASPLDGPGGPGGVVEVITRSAIGPTEAIIRAEAGDSPGGRGSATVRTALPEAAIRISGGGAIDNRQFNIAGNAGPSTIGQDTRTGQGALLVERAGESGRVGVDLWASHGHQFVPQNPASGMGFTYLFVDREDSFRGSLVAETRSGDLSLSARGFAQLLERDSTGYARTLQDTPTPDDVVAHRAGAIGQASLTLLPELRLLGALHFIYEDGTEHLAAQPPTASSSRLMEAALGGEWRPSEWLRLDGSGGAAAPFSVGGLSSPWPEGRLSLTLSSDLGQLRITGARKGRVPTLRELFSVAQTRASVGPEMSSYGEAQLVLRPHALIAATLDVYEKTIEGLIRIDRATNRFGNVGDVIIRGLDARLDFDPEGPLSAGLAYGFADPSSQLLGPNPIDFLPHHRLDAWIGARLEKQAGLWARVRWESERTDTQGATPLPAYATIDATLWYHLDHVRLLLRVENLLDRAYLARDSVPGFGRTILLGLEAVID